MELEEKQKLRYRLLAALYELTDHNGRQRIRGEKLQEHTGLETGEYRKEKGVFFKKKVSETHRDG
jgi:hypothetical protein